MWEGNKAPQPSDLLQRGKCQVMFVQESCFVTMSGHFENHTEATRNLKQALHHSDQKFRLIQVRKSANPRTDESFQQTVSQTWQGFKSRQDLTCPVFQAQKSDSRLTGLQFIMTLQSRVPHTHYAFGNPLQKSFIAISWAGRWRPHWQDALSAKQAGEQWPTLCSHQPRGCLCSLEKGRQFNSSSSCFPRWAARRGSQQAYTHI